ncbi:hypothetical protein FB45DRAFT_278133 [Roridomyces roridus]|uniref:Uncharacterized protein n=1 Tax=Roridomyces roridus TaxID=1738132 RepID=A0AAD7C9X8_9AGAR|nr:hypothetical protein FB45DRAFT_278133 [Roridomyces roridus]
MPSSTQFSFATRSVTHLPAMPTRNLQLGNEPPTLLRTGICCRWRAIALATPSIRSHWRCAGVTASIPSRPSTPMPIGFRILSLKYPRGGIKLVFAFDALHVLTINWFYTASTLENPAELLQTPRGAPNLVQANFMHLSFRRQGVEVPLLTRSSIGHLRFGQAPEDYSDDVLKDSDPIMT